MKPSCQVTSNIHLAGGCRLAIHILQILHKSKKGADPWAGLSKECSTALMHVWEKFVNHSVIKPFPTKHHAIEGVFVLF